MKSDYIRFFTFFQYFLKLNKIELSVKPFHEEVCNTLEAAFLGKLKKRIIIINISPRVGKTKLMEAFICWCYAYFPECHFIYASYSADLAHASTRYVLDTLQKSWYTKVYSNILGRVQKSDFFTTRSGGVMKGDGISGTLTGFGAGLKRGWASGAFICDDLQKPGEALSKAVTKEVQEWFTRTMTSRLNAPTVPTIICAQRISEDDVCGYVLRNFPDDVVHLKYPAMVDDVSQIPDTKTTEDLLTLKRVDPFTFYSQYQQEPIVLGGNLIKQEWFRYYDDDNLEFDYKFFTADTASKVKEHNDFSVFSCWGVIDKKLYLVDMVRGKFEAPELERVAIEFYNKHFPRMVLVEDKSSGIGLIQTLRLKGFPIVDVQRVKDKYQRVLDALPFLAIGVIYLRKDAEYLTALISECMNFRADMGHKHDDIVDTITDAIDHVFLNKIISTLDVL